MDRSLPHIPRPRDPQGEPVPLGRAYVAGLGRLSAAILVAGAFLDLDDAEPDPAGDFVGFGVSDSPDRIGG